MKTVVIGGHSRKVGKTAVAAGLIHAFSQVPWTAVKISSHWHETPAGEAPCIIEEEKVRGGHTDSARYLAAGAARSFWIRVRDGRMKESMPQILPVLQSSPFVLIESNGILEHIRPDLFIMVLRCDVDDFKDSARQNTRCADAAIVIEAESAAPAWMGFVKEAMATIPLFATRDPRILPAGLAEFIKSHLKIPGERLRVHD